MKRLILLTISALSLLFLVYPSCFLHLQTTLPDNNDTRLIAYIIGQVQENILHRQPLYYGTFFAPETNTLTYSDLFAGSAALTLPARFFTDSPVAIFNLALILGFTLTFICGYFLFRYILKAGWLAFLATLLFSLSGFRLSYLPHLQIFILWPLLLSTYLFLRFQKEGRASLLILCFLTVTFQAIESVFGLYLIFFTLFAVFLQYPKNWKATLLWFLPFLPLWIYILFQYLQTHLTFPEASRSIRDAAAFSLGLEEVFTKYHSWTVILLFFFALTFPRIPNTSKPWWTLFFFSLVMSLGPVVKFLGQTVKIYNTPLPLPYTLFYYLFPGFTGFRTPSRFIILVLLSATVLISIRLAPHFNKLQTKTKVILSLFLLSFLLLELRPPLFGYSVDASTPSVYQQVKLLPKEAAIIELPLKLWTDPNHEIESLRSLYSLKHGHRRFGGFSGFASQNWINHVIEIQTNGLTPQNTSYLRSLGITHLVFENTLIPL